MRTVLICYSVKSRKFSSNYERNKFYRGLHGWKQVVRKKETRYEYKKEGLLDEIPSMKVDNSIFIIPELFLKSVLEYFKEWDDKIDFNTFEININNRFSKIRENMLKKWEKELEKAF